MHRAEYATNGHGAGLFARLAGDAMAVPTDAELQALALSEGINFRTFTPGEFESAEFHVNYLVDRVLVESQPCVVAGPSKTLKTSVSIDLAVSLASGAAFLGEFNVREAKRVLFLSAESGLGVIRCAAQRIASTRGVRLSNCEIHWGGWVPRVKAATQLAAFRAAIVRSGAEVVFIDPAYHVVDGADAANVALMGQQLGDICRQVQHFGATPILVHHSTKTSARILAREPMELSDLAGAGVTEFFRQWLLLNRREAFAPDEPHRLWLSTGGSAGHASEYALDIDEHRQEQRPDGWTTVLQGGREVREAAEERKAAKKADREAKTLAKHVNAMRSVFGGSGSEGLTKTDACERTALSARNGGSAIEELRRDGWLEPCRVFKNGRGYNGFRRAKA